MDTIWNITKIGLVSIIGWASKEGGSYILGLYKDIRKEQEIFDGLLREVINELEYNSRPGIGNRQAPFKLASCEKITTHKKLSKSLKKEFEELFVNANLCNAYGNIKSLKCPPGGVKNICSALIKKIRGEYNNY